MSLSVLFVDDDQNILNGIRRMMFKIKDHEFHYAKSAREALELLKIESVNIIFSDLKMPGMDGFKLLNTIKDEYPHIVRIILSGHADMKTSLDSIKSAHRFIMKPCTRDDLMETIREAAPLSDFLSNEDIKKVVSRIVNLPALPDTYYKIQAEISKEDADMTKVGGYMARDAGLTANILKLVNSPFFGLPRKIDSVEEAVIYLGLDVIKGLVLSAYFFSKFEIDEHYGFSLDSFKQHSMAVANIAKDIAKSDGLDRKIQDQCFIAGILHDVGKIIIGYSHKDEFFRILKLTALSEINYREAEMNVINASHDKIGAYLLGLWGIERSVVSAVAHHHDPGLSASPEQFHVLAAVHAANCLKHQIGNPRQNSRTEALDTGFLDRLGLSERLPEWRKIAEDYFELVQKNN